MKSNVMNEIQVDLPAEFLNEMRSCIPSLDKNEDEEDYRHDIAENLPDAPKTSRRVLKFWISGDSVKSHIVETGTRY